MRFPSPARNIRPLTRDVLAWFRGTGKGYRTRINNMLRAFVAARRPPPG
jgi:uncharacterized protein (DUF4415 family)